jgi:tetratricopeptide (TPR) repeat protein
MSDYTVVRIDEIDEIDDGREPFRPVRHHLGIRAFGVNSWTAREAGDRIINEHDEDEPGGDEELYVVVSGHARFELDGESADAPVGTLVFVKPGVKRTAFAEEAGTTLLAIGATAGEAYEPFGWELWAPLRAGFQAGNYDEVADRGNELIEANPDYAGLLYNVACAESLAGRKADAIAHLRRSLELSASPRFREFAKDDSDLDPLRDEPEFKELMG